MHYSFGLVERPWSTERRGDSSPFLLMGMAFFDKFDRIIVYYDNGQVQLTKIITSLFNALFSNVEVRKVRPIDYKLFQVADLVCTMELLALKAEQNAFSNSELEFFDNVRSFKRDYLKNLRKKKMDR